MFTLQRLFVSAVSAFGLIAFLTVGIFSSPQTAQAHADHAGAKISFVEKKIALKRMLPDGAKIVRRKEALTEIKVAYAQSALNLSLDDSVHTYFLARDRESSHTTGLAMVRDIAYHHGEMSLAVGIDTHGNITEAAVLSIHGKYEADLDKSIGKGFLPTLKGKTLEDLKAMQAQVADDDPAAIEVLDALQGMVGLLRSFHYEE